MIHSFLSSAHHESPSLLTRNAGKARGKLVGGNLSVFSAMIGSSFLTLEDMRGAILFLEGTSLGTAEGNAYRHMTPPLAQQRSERSPTESIDT